MRVFTAAVSAVLMCFLLLKSTEGTDGGRAEYAGAYYNTHGEYIHGDDPYEYNPHHDNGHDDVYEYNNHYDYYPYEYDPLPSEPLQEGPKCTDIQECPSGYYFSTEGCACVSEGTFTTPPQKYCTLSSAVCNRRQHLNLDTCSCECVEYSLFIPGIPAIPAIPGRFVHFKNDDRGKNREGSKESRRRSSKRRRRGAKDSLVELDNKELMREVEGRFERSRSSGSRSGSSSGSRSSNGKVFIPGQPAIPAQPSFIQLVSKCPPKTKVDEINCKCEE